MFTDPDTSLSFPQESGEHTTGQLSTTESALRDSDKYKHAGGGDKFKHETTIDFKHARP